MDVDSEHIQLSQEPHPSHCHPADAVTKSSKDHSTFLSSQLPQDGGGHGKVSQSYDQQSGLFIKLFLCLLFSPPSSHNPLYFYENTFHTDL